MKNAAALLLLSVFMLSTFLSCKEDISSKQETLLLKDEIKLSENARDVTISLASFGINSFEKIRNESRSVMQFSISAVPSKVNTIEMDLANTRVQIIKDGAKSYTISFLNNGLAGHILHLDELTKQLIYTRLPNTTIITNESYSKLSLIDQTHFILLYSLLGEALIGGGERVKITGAKTQKLYYGYTIGWGATKEESVNHEATVRQDPETIHDQMTNYCMYLGTSKSCVWENFGCVTTSTFWCGDNAPVRLHN